MDVILDHDGSSDDIIALLFLLSHPNIKVAGVTVSGTGEVHGPIGAENISLLLQYLGRPDIPIAFGTEKTFSPAGKPFPSDFRIAIDNIFKNINLKELFPNVDLAHQLKPVIKSSAVELIKELIEKKIKENKESNKNEKITILATGPLTNIAEFLKQYPALAEQIEKIVIMGGAVNVAGNIEALDEKANNKVAEWNIYADPAAAQFVFESGVPVVMVPLDATNQVPMTKKFYEDLGNQLQPELKLIHKLFNIIIDAVGMKVFLEHFYLWDPLAAMICAEPELAEINKMKIEVDQTTAQTKLMSNDSKASPIHIAEKIHHPESILSRLIETIKKHFMNRVAKVSTTNHLFPEQKTQISIEPPISNTQGLQTTLRNPN